MKQTILPALFPKLLDYIMSNTSWSSKILSKVVKPDFSVVSVAAQFFHKLRKVCENSLDEVLFPFKC